MGASTSVDEERGSNRLDEGVPAPGWGRQQGQRDRSGRLSSSPFLSPQRLHMSVQGPKLDDIEVQDRRQQRLGIFLGGVFVGAGHGFCEPDLTG